MTINHTAIAHQVLGYIVATEEAFLKPRQYAVYASFLRNHTHRLEYLDKYHRYAYYTYVYS